MKVTINKVVKAINKIVVSLVLMGPWKGTDSKKANLILLTILIATIIILLLFML